MRQLVIISCGAALLLAFLVPGMEGDEGGVAKEEPTLVERVKRLEGIVGRQEQVVTQDRTLLKRLEKLEREVQRSSSSGPSTCLRYRRRE